jgi:hypothetical protein
MKHATFDLGKAIEAQSNSPLGYGSEFKPPEVLEQLFRQSQLQRGSIWPLDDLSKEDRIADLKEALVFGNRKQATENPELLRSLCNKAVTHMAMPSFFHWNVLRRSTAYVSTR